MFFEYYVVRVDDQGRTHFLADVYKLDQMRGMPDDPDANSCARKVSPTEESDGDTSAPSDVSGDLGP